MEKSQVRISSPCTLDWQKMTPADGGRFCGDCKKVVRNLSSMTEGEAKAVLKTAGDGELCVRFLHDKHGRVFFGGNESSSQRKSELLAPSLLHRARRVAVAAAIAAVPFAAQACGGEIDSLAAPATKQAQTQRTPPRTPSDETDPPDDTTPTQYVESMGGVSSDALSFLNPNEDVQGDAGVGSTDGGEPH